MTRNQGKQLFCLCFPFGLFRKFQIVKLSERSSCDVSTRQEQGRALDVLPTCSGWEQHAPARARPQPFGGFSGLKVPGNSEITAAHTSCLHKQSRCLHKCLALGARTVLLTRRTLPMHLQYGMFLCLCLKGARSLLLQSHHVTAVFDAYCDFQRKSLQTLGQVQICLFMLGIVAVLCRHFLSLQQGHLQRRATQHE